MIALCLAIACWFGEIGERNRYELTEVKWHDADTCEARIELGWQVSIKEHIRASNYDAWEITKQRRTVGPISDAEIARGKAAKAFVDEFSKDGKLYIVPNGTGQRDVYGRILGEIWQHKVGEWINLGDLMREKGHVRK